MASPINILVVDDEESIRFLFDRFLTKAGYEVHTAFDIPEAMRLIAEKEFHAALIDRILPGNRNGLDLIRHLKSAQPFCRTILVTAYPSYESAAEALGYGTHSYLTKPVTREQIRRVVDAAVDTSMAERDAWRRQNFFQSLFEVSAAPSVICDADGRVTAANTAFFRRFGYAPPEIIGHPLPIVPPWDRKAFTGEIARFFKEGSASERKTERITKSGEILSVTQHLFAGCGSRPVEALILLRDTGDAAIWPEKPANKGPSPQLAGHSNHTLEPTHKGDPS